MTEEGNDHLRAAAAAFFFFRFFRLLTVMARDSTKWIRIPSSKLGMRRLRNSKRFSWGLPAIRLGTSASTDIICKISPVVPSGCTCLPIHVVIPMLPSGLTTMKPSTTSLRG